MLNQVLKHLPFLALTGFFLLGVPMVFADQEMEIDMSGGQPQATAAPAASTTQVAPAAMPAAPPPPAVQPAAQPAAQQAPQSAPQTPATATAAQPQTQETETQDESIDVAEPTPTPVIGQGTFKVKYSYEAGIKAYKQKDYEKAIRYLKQAVTMKKDPYTPKYIVAEADAMLGVIYQFRIINYRAAYHYYLQALKVDPSTRTARKHLPEIKRHLRKKEYD